MDYKDYYNILGIQKNATEKEIKSAYRKLARQYHPDVSSAPDAEERFKNINEAYEVLRDPEKRAKYDRLGSDWQRWQQGGGRADDFDWTQWQTAGNGQRVYVQYGAGAPGDLGDLFGNGNTFSDFFEAIFGGMGRSGQPNGGGFDRFNQFNQFDQSFRTTASPQQSQDIEHPVDISLAEAYNGTSRLLEIGDRRLEVKIPAGAETGTRVRIRGIGANGTNGASNGAPNGAAGSRSGDLYLRVTVAADPRFERKGDDLHTSISVDLYTAVLGGEVRVPTLSGAVTLKIPAGTQNGQTFRLRGKGMPNLRQPDRNGDLYARLDVRLPAKLNAKQRALFEQLRDLD